MVAWDKVCQPKNLGGLGLRKTEAVSLAFQAKLAWKVLGGLRVYGPQLLSKSISGLNVFLIAKLRALTLSRLEKCNKKQDFSSERHLMECR